MIAEAIDKVGKDGVITVEESQTFGMEMDLVEGMRFDKGYISPYFVTDPERMEAVFEDAYILLVGQQDLGGHVTCFLCSRRSCRPASPLPSSPRTSKGRPLRLSWSTRSAAHSRAQRSRHPGSESAARPCCRTSRS